MTSIRPCLILTRSWSLFSTAALSLRFPWCAKHTSAHTKSHVRFFWLRAEQHWPSLSVVHYLTCEQHLLSLPPFPTPVPLISLLLSLKHNSNIVCAPQSTNYQHPDHLFRGICVSEYYYLIIELIRPNKILGPSNPHMYPVDSEKPLPSIPRSPIPSGSH